MTKGYARTISTYDSDVDRAKREGNLAVFSGLSHECIAFSACVHYNLPQNGITFYLEGVKWNLFYLKIETTHPTPQLA